MLTCGAVAVVIICRNESALDVGTPAERTAILKAQTAIPTKQTVLELKNVPCKSSYRLKIANHSCSW